MSNGSASVGSFAPEKTVTVTGREMSTAANCGFIAIAADPIMTVPAIWGATFAANVEAELRKPVRDVMFRRRISRGCPAEAENISMTANTVKRLLRICFFMAVPFCCQKNDSSVFGKINCGKRIFR